MELWTKNLNFVGKSENNHKKKRRGRKVTSEPKKKITNHLINKKDIQNGRKHGGGDRELACVRGGREREGWTTKPQRREAKKAGRRWGIAAGGKEKGHVDRKIDGHGSPGSLQL